MNKKMVVNVNRKHARLTV